MKKMIKLIGITLAFLAFGANVIAQSTASAYAHAVIISPISITKEVDLNFGNVAVTNQIGTIELSTAGVRTGTGGATPVANPTGVVTAASFTITANGGYHIFITLPPDTPTPVRVTHTNGTDFMTVTNFMSDPVTNFIMPAGGTQTLLVGATLNTGISQAPGVYHTLTNFPVTVNYN
jgi:hypothetical protein